MRQIALLALLVSLLVSSTALGEFVFPGYHPTGDPVSFESRYFAVGTGTYAVQTDTHVNVTDDWCIPFGASVYLRCAAAVSFCWSQSATVAIGNGTTHGVMTDAEGGGTNTGAASDTKGQCWEAPQDIGVVRLLHRGVFVADDKTKRVGWRGGYCTNDTAGMAQKPCNDVNDCGGVASSCVTPTETARKMNNCSYLLDSAAVATNCKIEIWR